MRSRELHFGNVSVCLLRCSGSILEDPSLKLLLTQEDKIAMLQIAPVTMPTWHTETRGYVYLVRSHHSCGLYSVAASLPIRHSHVQIFCVSGHGRVGSEATYMLNIA